MTKVGWVGDKEVLMRKKETHLLPFLLALASRQLPAESRDNPLMLPEGAGQQDRVAGTPDRSRRWAGKPDRRGVTPSRKQRGNNPLQYLK